WPDFIARQRAEAVARHRARGLDAAWLDRIEPFLARWAPEAGGRTVLLHTEVMREHLLVERDTAGWRCSGLIDFEPAMPGAPDYEFASVGLFVSGGERRLLHRLLRAYGHPGLDRDTSLPMRLLALALLHRYGHLRWYLQRLPVPGAGTLEALAERWFGVDAGG
ncbi:MAG: phosphotransferase, partial [Burkholderiales bacterium]|nr:phosphotransferase [Burkholderiales bacterium]